MTRRFKTLPIVSRFGMRIGVPAFSRGRLQKRQGAAAGTGWKWIAAYGNGLACSASLAGLSLSPRLLVSRSVGGSIEPGRVTSPGRSTCSSSVYSLAVGMPGIGSIGKGAGRAAMIASKHQAKLHGVMA